jgi:prepilin signal peptidase PulO-like enzyme (type II secretory pathway)
LIQFVIFSLFGVCISVIDWQQHRIPNKVSGFLFLALLISTLLTQEKLVVNGLKHSFIFFIVFLILFLVSRTALGFGDVKYAISCGFLIGILNPSNWLITIWLMFILAGIYGLISTLLGKTKLSASLAFAPFMTLSVITTSLNSLH